MVPKPADTAPAAVTEPRPSTLPFDPGELMAMRVRPAAFARMCQVSRQSVSKWISTGLIRLGPDGLLDPVVASRELMNNADPTRLRARVFKTATASLGELRQRVQSLEAAVADANARVESMIHPDDLAGYMYNYCRALVERFAELEAAHAAGRAIEWLDLLEGEYIWQLSEDELRDAGAELADSRETPPMENADYEKAT